MPRRRHQWLLAAVAPVISAILHASVHAQVVHDGTVGTGGALAGPNFTIPATRGQVRGGNLFHSFSQFNVQAGQSANFTPPATGTINNVLARVTGGSQSTIDGALRSTVPGANLFLINPAGVVFGGNATLDVQGSFHVTSADFIRMADGKLFHAATPSQTVLTSAAPAAFGFISQRTDTTHGVTIEGTINQPVTLAVPDGKVLSVVGSPVRIVNGKLAAAGGRINLVSAHQGEVSFDPTDATNGSKITVTDRTDNAFGGGSLTMTDSVADAGANAGGHVAVSAVNASLERSFIDADTEGGGKGQGIRVDIVDLLVSDGSAIRARTTGTADAGGVVVRAQDVVALDAAGSTQRTGILASSGDNSQGRAGDVSITASGLAVLNGAGVSTGTLGSGNAGNLTVDAGEVFLDGGTTLEATALSVGSGSKIDGGDAGTLSVIADTLDLTRGGVLQAFTLGQGAGGVVNINAGLINIDGSRNTDAFTGISADTFSETGGGAGRGININAGSLTIAGGAQVSARTFGPQDGGSIFIDAAGNVLLDGQNIGATIGTDTINTVQGGRGGDLTLSARSLKLVSGGFISVGTSGQGQGGNVTINTTRDVTVDGGRNPSVTAITAATFGNAVGGDGGDINITARNLIVRRGGKINSTSLGPGDVGDITIRAEGDVLVDSEGKNDASTLSSDTLNPENSGLGGTIDIEARNLTLRGNGLVSARTFGPEAGGNIRVFLTEDLTIFGGPGGNASIGTDSQNTTIGGDGGDISITARNIHLSNTAAISSGTLGPGDSGDVMIKASSLTLSDAGADHDVFINAASTSPTGGLGGNITLDVGELVIRDGATVIASNSGPQRGGNITVTNARRIVVDGGAAALETSITTEAGGEGPGGNLSIEKAGNILIRSGGRLSALTTGNGKGGTVSIDAGKLTIDGAKLEGVLTGIGADTAGFFGGGDGGTVNLTLGALRILDGGSISANTLGPQMGGNINIDAGSITIDGGGNLSTGIATDSGNPALGGPGGSIDIGTREMRVVNGGRISAGTTGPGDAGNVDVVASETIVIDGGKEAQFAVINSSTLSQELGGKGGDVTISSRDLTILNSGGIASITQGRQPGGRVILEIGGKLRMDGGTDGGIAFINTDSINAGLGGPAGDITIRAGSIDVRHGGQIASETGGTGMGGTISITASDVLLSREFGQETGVFARTFSTDAGAGRGGDIVIQTGQLNIENQAQISAETGGPGNGGNIAIFGFNRLEGIPRYTDLILGMFTGGGISADTFGTGRGGNVLINGQVIFLDGGESGMLTPITANTRTDTGRGGRVKVAGRFVTLLRQAQIGGNTFGPGDSRNVTVRAQELLIDGGGIPGFTGIAAQSASADPGAGDAGEKLQVFADSIRILNGGEISAATFGEGDGGNVDVVAGTIEIDGFDGQILTAINAQTAEDTLGRGGNVTVSADRIDLRAGGRISASSFGQGQGGSVRVRPRTRDLSIHIDGGPTEVNSGLISSSFGTGVGGSVDVIATDVTLRNNGSIQAQAPNSDGGSIRVIASHAVDVYDSTISAFTGGKGGNIEVSAIKRVQFVRSLMTAQSGDGGQITIDPEFVVLNNSTINGLSNGQPVQVQIDPNAIFFQSIDSRILTESLSVPPPIDIAGSLVPLTSAFVASDTQLLDVCAVRLGNTQVSSFIITGRGSFSPEPGGTSPTLTVSGFGREEARTAPAQ